MRPHDPKHDGLNGAQSMAKVQAMPEQVDYLIEQMQADKSIDMENDWKMVNILMGANNMCIACHKSRVDGTKAYYKAQYKAALEKLRLTVPKLWVNAVLMFN